MQNGASPLKDCMENPQIKIQLAHGLALPLLGIYSKDTETLIQMDICTPMIIAALFAVIKEWKQPKCSTTDD